MRKIRHIEDVTMFTIRAAEQGPTRAVGKLKTVDAAPGWLTDRIQTGKKLRHKKLPHVE